MLPSSSKKPMIVFTGGGTAGHVTPNVAIMDALPDADIQMAYIGSETGVEKKLIAGVPYYGISTGKLRRYFSWQNFLDPFRIMKGILQAFFILRRLEAQLVFSKGGFVAFPVVFAAWLLRIPVIAHESDRTPGLANRLSLPFLSILCMTFPPDPAFHIAPHKLRVTGSPVRPSLMQGDRATGLRLCGFMGMKPVLLVMGGGQGSELVNQALRAALPVLTRQYDIIHLCGEGKLDTALQEETSYYQCEYARETLPDLFAACDVVVSRSGSNALYEILALQKPHLLIPLSRRYSRGDQIDNARYFEKIGISRVLDEALLSPEALSEAIQALDRDKKNIHEQLQTLNIQSAAPVIADMIIKQVSASPAF